MNTVIDKLFFTSSGRLLAWLAAPRRRRPTLIDLRDLSPYVQRDIGLLDGDDAIASRLSRQSVDQAFTPPAPTAAPSRCAHP